MTDMPLACLREDGRFLWANTALTNLCGWSIGQLSGVPAGTGMRLQDLTPLESIGPEGESSKQVRDGDKPKITHMVTLQKRDGSQVAVIQTVWRHPPFNRFKCFILQLHVIGMTDSEMHAIEKRFADQDARFTALMNGVITRMERVERERDSMARQHDHHEHDQKTSVNIGTASTAWIVAILIPLIGMLGYLAYLVAWPNHQGGAKPPEIHAPLTP